MNALLDKIGHLIGTHTAGGPDPNTPTEDWGRLSGAEKIARAEGLAREAYKAGDKDLAQKWRDLAAEIASHHKLGG